jgi:glutathione peroxidase-family protein
MEAQEKEYFLWLLRKCKVNLQSEFNQQLITEIDQTIKKLVGTHGDVIQRYEPDPEPETKEEQT